MVALQRFQSLLNQDVPDSFLVDGQGGQLTLPIAYVEDMLDAFFLGCWSIENFRFQVIANELVGSLDLVVRYPFMDFERRLSGVAASKIRQRKGADLDDINAKLKNALEMDAPRLKAMCLKNAAANLGQMFGRNVNRELAPDEPLAIIRKPATDLLDEVVQNSQNEPN